MSEDAFGEYLGDTQAIIEMGAIKGMLRVAAEHGLEAEVVREMAHQVDDGVDIGQACANALVEWDL